MEPFHERPGAGAEAEHVSAAGDLVKCRSAHRQCGRSAPPDGKDAGHDLDPLGAEGARTRVESNPKPSGSAQTSYPSSSASSPMHRMRSSLVSIGVSATPRRRSVITFPLGCLGLWGAVIGCIAHAMADSLAVSPHLHCGSAGTRSRFLVQHPDEAGLSGK